VRYLIRFLQQIFSTPRTGKRALHRLTREEALRLMLNYMAGNEATINMEEYSLGLLSYHEDTHIWSAIFDCKSKRGQGFGLQLIEGEEPEFLLYTE
jgi:hypothetical protein